MITSEAQLAEAQAVAERLAAADWDLSLRAYVSSGEHVRHGIEREVVRRKLARLEADIAEYQGQKP